MVDADKQGAIGGAAKGDDIVCFGHLQRGADIDSKGFFGGCGLVSCGVDRHKGHDIYAIGEGFFGVVEDLTCSDLPLSI